MGEGFPGLLFDRNVGIGENQSVRMIEPVPPLPFLPPSAYPITITTPGEACSYISRGDNSLPVATVLHVKESTNRTLHVIDLIRPPSSNRMLKKSASFLRARQGRLADKRDSQALIRTVSRDSRGNHEWCSPVGPNMQAIEVLLRKKIVFRNLLAARPIDTPTQT